MPAPLRRPDLDAPDVALRPRRRSKEVGGTWRARFCVVAVLIAALVAPPPSLARPQARPAAGKAQSARGQGKPGANAKSKASGKSRASPTKGSQARGKSPGSKNASGKGSGKGSGKSGSAAARKGASAPRGGKGKVRHRSPAEVKRLTKACAGKKASKTAQCKEFAAERRALAEEAALARCRKKPHAKTSACKKLLAAHRVKQRATSICGRRYGTARKRESVARFARRNGAREAEVRRWNDLGPASKLKAGRRYVVYKSPYEGERLRDGVLLAAEEGVLSMQRPERGHGRPALVAAIALAARSVQQTEPRGSHLVVGDLSKEGGGCLPPHRSHRGGVDADIGYYHLGGRQRGWLGLATPEDLDADRTWQLIAALRATGRLRYAFIDYDLQPELHEAAVRAGESPGALSAMFQYPRPREASKSGVIRHLKGHADHMHVRLACAAEQPCDLSEAERNSVAATDLPMRGRVGGEGHRGRLAPPSRLAMSPTPL